MIRWSVVNFLIYSIIRRSWINAAPAAEESNVINERFSRINAAAYHNNAAFIRGL